MKDQETKKDGVELAAPIIPTRKLDIVDVLGEAWKLTYGAKWAIWAPYLCAMVISVLSGIFAAIMTAANDVNPHTTSPINAVAGIVFMLALSYFSVGLFAGMVKVSIERARGFDESGFHSFSRTIPVLLTMICCFICALPGLILLPEPIALIFIVLITPFFVLSIPFAVDKINSPFKAIILSVKAIKGNYLILLGIYAVLFIITAFLSSLSHALGAIGGIFLIIVDIWLVPFMILMQGVIYHKLVD